MRRLLLAFMTFAPTQFFPGAGSALELNPATGELSNLSDRTDCAPKQVIRGKVIRREFAIDALTLTGVVIEQVDGSREFVNIDIPDGLSMAELDLAHHGLLTLLKQGRLVRATVRLCGAGGRVMELDAVK